MVRIVLVSIALASSTTAARAESDEPEAVEPITVREVIPPESGEVAGRVTVDATREPMSNDVVLAPRVQLFANVAHRLGAELEVPMSVRLGPEREMTLGGISIGVGYAVREANPHLSVLAEVVAPTGDGEPEAGAGLGAAFVHRRAVAQMSCIYSAPHGALEVGASFALALTHGVHAFAEATLSTAESTVIVGPGLKVHVTRDLFFAGAAQFGAAGEATRRATLQVQYGF